MQSASSDLDAWVTRRDECAFNRLVAQHVAMVTGVCRRQLPDPEDVADAVQAVFIIFAQRSASIQHHQALGSWLYRVAMGVCRQSIRSQARRASHERAAMTQAMDADQEASGSDDLRADLDAAIATLCCDEREVVIEHYLQGQPLTLVADRLGVSEKTLRKRLTVALANLQQWFAGRGVAIGGGALAVFLTAQARAAEPGLQSRSVQAALHPAQAVRAQALASGAMTNGEMVAMAGLQGMGSWANWAMVLGLAIGMVVAASVWIRGSASASASQGLSAIPDGTASRDHARAPQPTPQVGVGVPTGYTVAFVETFDDADLEQRGWYDNTRLALSTREYIPGSKKSAEYRWLIGSDEVPTTGGPSRRIIPEATAVYVSYWVKYSKGYTTAGHLMREMFLLTNLDEPWCGLSDTRLTACIGQSEGTPYLNFQDARNIDIARLDRDLSNVTEKRSVAGGNGERFEERATAVDCWQLDGGRYGNSKRFSAGQMQIADGSWHRIEACFRLNRIVGGKGLGDGTIRCWCDGRLIIERDNVIMRTARHPEMRFSQFAIAPYLRGGIRAEQTFWIDDLTVATAPE